MPTNYKTPGVYIEEITKFPPSIAPVETAIPAFVGYTQKADKVKPGDLLNVPTKIGSIADYEMFFGTGAAPTVTNVTLDDNRNFKSADVGNVFYMYDSLRLFYTNGGGDCYIVSTGSYLSAGKVLADFFQDGKDIGLGALEKEDEPTILVFPDNSLLNDTDFYTVYVKALAQCESLQDRVGLLHVKEDDPRGDQSFRSNTGTTALKYGMAYTPWLEVNFPKDISYRAFKDVIVVGSSKFKLADLIDQSDPSAGKMTATITQYEQVIADVNKVAAASDAVAGKKNGTLRDRYGSLKSDYQGGKTHTSLEALVDFMFEVAREVDLLVGGTSGAIANAELKKTMQGIINPTLKDSYDPLIGHEKELEAKVAGYTTQFGTGTVPSAADWGTIFSAPPGASDDIPAAAASDSEKMDSMLSRLDKIFDTINGAWLGGVVGAAQKKEQSANDGLAASCPIYKTILNGIQNTSTAVPPSGAVAGIYAYVDRTRGVWKAPANVSIAGIVGPKDSFRASELDNLNIDPNSGKSINVIRSFTGKGTMIYGARTLAGNDNEWKYVSVRRFFNMVEESSKKATEQFVFEPNDANTWVRVQAMLENFLTVLWRQGALQGIKPEHAFYVAVGLGKTMTALDILEGRMIIEIGMAAVRPAEFIVLRFSHKMAES